MSAVKNKYHDILESMPRDRVLVLNLTHYWFAQYESGFKKEEYRKITDHWIKRLLSEPLTEVAKFKEFDYLDLRKGYTTTRLIYPINEMDIRHPKQEWSPKEWWDERCFVIAIGNLTYSNVK